MRGQPGQNKRLHARSPDQFPGHGCMDDLTTKRFDSQTMWVIAMLGKNILKCYSWMFIQPGIGGRPVDWCML